MDYRLTEEQELLIESLRQVLVNEITESYLAECDENHVFPDKLADALMDNGFGLLGVPEEYGGTPCDVLTQIMVIEELARAGGPAYMFTNAMLIDDMLTFGNEEQKRITMEYAGRGRMAFSLGISEPQAGSDDSAIASTATRRNGKVYLNGHKTWISNAGEYPYCLFLTRDPQAPNPHKAISMWWVDMTKPGIKLQAVGKVGFKMSKFYELYLEDVEVEEKDLVGVEGEGFLQLMKNFEIERLAGVAASLGWAQGAFDDAVRYANQRVQFGKPIGNFQLIQKKITEMQIKLETMRSMLYKACWEKENGISVQISSALCKYYVARAAQEVIDDAMQIFGGIGYTTETRIQRFWRDCRANRIGGGTDEIMVHIAGRAILKKYKK